MRPMLLHFIARDNHPCFEALYTMILFMNTTKEYIPLLSFLEMGLNYLEFKCSSYKPIRLTATH